MDLTYRRSGVQTASAADSAAHTSPHVCGRSSHNKSPPMEPCGFHGSTTIAITTLFPQRLAQPIATLPSSAPSPIVTLPQTLRPARIPCPHSPLQRPPHSPTAAPAAAGIRCVPASSGWGVPCDHVCGGVVAAHHLASGLGPVARRMESGRVPPLRRALSALYPPTPAG